MPGITRYVPQAGRRADRGGLSRSQVETLLEQTGAWASGQQLRGVTRVDLNLVMEANGKQLGSKAPTGEGLPLSDLHFVEAVDLRGLYLADVDLSRTELLRADLTGARLHNADLSGALLTRSNLESAELHDAAMESAWMPSVNCVNAKLFRANLRNADLREARFANASLGEADLRGATLWRADLQNADLWRTDLRGADLWRANLNGADLSGANLQTTNLKAANLAAGKFGYVRRENTLPVLASVDGTTCLDEVTWSGDFISPEEIAAGVNDGKETASTYDTAAKVYRMLRDAHERSGIYEVADQFAYREGVSRRKQARRERAILAFASLLVAELLFGYGFRWKRVVASAGVVLLGFAVIYWSGGLFGGYGASQFWKSCYFSAVSFTGVGYGSWIPDSPSPVKYLGAVEALAGVFLMALFLVTFTRRYTR